MSIILFLIILAALIAAHEFGHFLVAKLAGIRVDEFALGFPPRIFRFRRGETNYTLNLIPFGGFVKIFGEDPDESVLESPDRSRSFIAKPRYIQAAVLSAGIIFNIIFAWLLLTIALTAGFPTPVGYNGKTAIQNAKITIIEVVSNTPAAKAGFAVGDQVIALQSKQDLLSGALNVDSVQNFVNAHQDEEIGISVMRKNEMVRLLAVPAPGIVPDRAALGVSLAEVGTLKLPFYLAFIEAAKLTFHTTLGVAKSILDFLFSVILGKANFSEITGPVGIVNMVGNASEFGFSYLLGFTAFISINLAVINLIPFPALDGGRLLFVTIEAITRRSLNPRITNLVNALGFVILIILMVIVTYKDVIRFF